MFYNFLIIKFKKIIQKLENHNYFIYRSFQFIREHILKKNFWKPYISYSQLGEDLALQKLSRNYDYKTFLDIGSYHPFRYSNTRLLKKNQWRGVHVDA